ncbi:DNA methyltransferase [Bifidobacterium sp. SO1]|uniref:DNA-methyltransferase n=1 Tax=Bifidobacterium sp. SO1 TaxID=2809029 RepID=UPI001BDCDB33|nr:DNA methyltransferase [Bifidobacterium sp. SO1]MBT1161782.1 site-specific DNA-methyltransferase [Bifidobacterium sp. SO1]
MNPLIDTDDIRLYNTDARRLPDIIPPATADAIVTDPPYELALGTSGRVSRWDSTGIAFDPEFWHAMLTPMKPGAHALVFGSPRTWHRLACAMEDAGWHIQGQICWLYASGMPKGEWGDHAVDKALGHTDDRTPIPRDNPTLRRAAMHDRPYTAKTREAREWAGWNPTLKPAWEPILICRKPRENTLGRTLLDHGTGAFHVAACTLDADMTQLRDRYRLNANPNRGPRDGSTYRGGGTGRPLEPRLDGRYPSDVILDPRLTDILPAGTPPFYYSPKATGDERPIIRDMPLMRPIRRDDEWEKTCERLGLDPDADPIPLTLLDPDARALCEPAGSMTVAHPTVKPLDLIRRLVRLAVHTGGLVLEPFAGSGTTLDACRIEGMRCAATELDPLYAPLIRLRLDHPVQRTLF